MNLRKIIQLARDPKILFIKILRRINTKRHSINIRFNTYFELESEKIPEHISFDSLYNLSAKPGNPLFFHHYYDDKKCYEKNDAENIFNHKLNIFSEEYFDLNIKNIKNIKKSNKFLQMCEELPLDVINNYKPINWHSDFKSGYCWDDQLLYLDIPLVPHAKADIKIPRELSRFQHIGEIFFSHRAIYLGLKDATVKAKLKNTF